MNWVSILGDISIWIILTPLLIGVAGFKRLNTDSKLVLAIVVIGSIPQVLRSFYTSSALLTLLYNLYTPCEFIIYYLLFRSKITTRGFRIFFIGTGVAFFLFSSLFIARFGLEKRIINEWVMVNNILQISWICLCLMEYYKNEEITIESYQPFFWFLVGITAYSTCTVVFYCLWYFIKSQSSGQVQLLKVIHHIFNITLYICFCIGLLKNYSKIKIH